MSLDVLRHPNNFNDHTQLNKPIKIHSDLGVEKKQSILLQWRKQIMNREKKIN